MKANSTAKTNPPKPRILAEDEEVYESEVITMSLELSSSDFEGSLSFAGGKFMSLMSFAVVCVTLLSFF